MAARYTDVGVIGSVIKTLLYMHANTDPRSKANISVQDGHHLDHHRHRTAEKDGATMSGGLLRDPSRIWHDAAFRRDMVVQLGILFMLLVLSAFYHFVLRRPRTVVDSAGVADEEIAEIDSLIVYPVKSGRGIELSKAQVSRKGFKFDRRWAIVADKGLKRLNLKDEPRLTLIVPSFEGETLRLGICAESTVQLPDIGVPLEPDEKTLRSWPLVQNIHFYGDYADGREAQLDGDGWEWKDTPSAWVSKV